MKESLGSAAVARIAQSMARLLPQFNAQAFEQEALQGLDALELKARVQRLIGVLHRHYKLPFPQLSEYLQDLPAIWAQTAARSDISDNNNNNSTNNSYAVFAAWPIIDYVAVHGLQHPHAALQTLEKLTPLFSAEFAIRPFLEHYPELTLAQMLQWCEHPCEHVRRLASEGCRPRLPWGAQLVQFRRNPEPLRPILEKLNNDPSAYVRRSVANNLNDIGKDNPDWLVALCETWLNEPTAQRRWIVKHALRSLIKAGDTRVFALLGYSADTSIRVGQLQLDKTTIHMGDALAFSLPVSAEGHAQNLVVDYAVHFQKANGTLAPKVFKLTTLAIAAGQTQVISKRHGFKPITTRRYYAGTHVLAVHINGVEVARQAFELII